MLKLTAYLKLWLSSKTKSDEEYVHETKEMRENLTQKQIDKIDEDSFPSSDPPGRY